MKMRTYPLAAGALLLASGALSEGRFSYVDRANSLSASATGGRISQQPGPKYKLALSGGVRAESKSQGLSFQSSQLILVATPSSQSANRIETATATGNVRIVKSTAQAGSQRQAVLTSSSAVFREQGSSGAIDLKGPVSVLNSDVSKKQMLSASGASGRVIVDSSRSGGNGLRSATLTNNVRVILVQADGSKVIGTGSKLVVDYVARPPTATLTGGVAIRGEGESSLGTIQNVAKAVLTLNERGEVVSFEVG